ncbi:chemosensory pili system protein ChpC [Fontimonas thermophila]|uniref:Chemosensory pili system protein ChpC n=1 Tax=Fontimonas thermophila TaxID=1076937 RepID=A0A1I2JKW3_9GAMM|nr:chemotaxis protein CheW [Fontimonas thermophila]SFF54889.1 chemosensory pili system protein ChpC [Fontimonas thermophila]
MNREQVYAVLMALHEDVLLLPNAAVAEVLARDALQRGDRGHEWLLGHCEWNNRRVPVVRFEVLNGGRDAGDPRRERIVVLNSVGRHLPSGQLAIVTQGYPHLVTLNRAAMQPVELDAADRSDLVLSRVRIANQVALIPDLETLEAEIAHAQRA